MLGRDGDAVGFANAVGLSGRAVVDEVKPSPADRAGRLDRLSPGRARSGRVPTLPGEQPSEARRSASRRRPEEAKGAKGRRRGRRGEAPGGGAVGVVSVRSAELGLGGRGSRSGRSAGRGRRRRRRVVAAGRRPRAAESRGARRDGGRVPPLRVVKSHHERERRATTLLSLAFGLPARVGVGVPRVPARVRASIGSLIAVARRPSGASPPARAGGARPRCSAASVMQVLLGNCSDPRIEGRYVGVAARPSCSRCCSGGGCGARSAHCSRCRSRSRS
jgi:hypothetical protein